MCATKWYVGQHVDELSQNMNEALEEILDDGDVDEKVCGVGTPHKTFVQKTENLRSDRKQIQENECRCEGLRRTFECYKPKNDTNNCIWACITALMTGCSDPREEFDYLVSESIEFSKREKSCQGEEHYLDAFSVFTDMTNARVKIHSLEKCEVLEWNESSSSKVGADLMAHFYKSEDNCYQLILPKEELVDFTELTHIKMNSTDIGGPLNPIIISDDDDTLDLQPTSISCPPASPASSVQWKQDDFMFVEEQKWLS